MTALKLHGQKCFFCAKDLIFWLASSLYSLQGDHRFDQHRYSIEPVVMSIRCGGCSLHICCGIELVVSTRCGGVSFLVVIIIKLYTDEKSRFINLLSSIACGKYKIVYIQKKKKSYH